jgi:tetratricopeptide (TPR) repeat protein
MTTGIWRSVPVFVSSTFVDMHAERDHLRRFVFPELEERLRRRNCHLEPIDLRWGVSPDMTTADEHAMEMAVLSVCFHEIGRSRLLVIGLLGDRYGWIPPPSALRRAAAAAGIKNVPETRSITELELIYAMREFPENVLVYCREPLPYSAMPPKVAARYADACDRSRDGGDRATLLQGLKSWLARERPGGFKTYAASWEPATEAVCNLEVWGRQVVDDVWAILDPQTRTESASIAGPFGEDAWEIEQFAAERCRVFLGRDALLRRVHEACIAPTSGSTGRIICIKGPPGSGKSAVFSRLREMLLLEPSLLLEHATGISKSSTLPSRMRARWTHVLERELSLGGEEAPSPLQDGASEAEKTAHFAALLSKVANKRRVVLLVDSLESLEDLDTCKRLQWLPDPLSENVVVVATALESLSADFFREGMSIEEIALPPLDRREARAIAVELFRRVGRTVAPAVLEVLLAKAGSGCELAAGSPLWLSMAVSELNEIDASDFERAERDGEFTGSAGERLVQLIKTIAGELPEDIAALYDWLIDRVEAAQGARSTRELLNLIAVSRSGLRETDIDALMAGTVGVTWTQLSFAELRRSLRSHIVQRGSDAQWTFAHEQMRAAVNRRNLAPRNAAPRVHRKLALMLMTRPAEDQMRVRQTLHHLLEAGSLDMAAIYLANEQGGFDGLEASLDLMRFLARNNPELIETLLEQPTLDDNRRLKLCSLITRAVRHLSDGAIPLAKRAAALKATEATLTGSLSAFGTSPAVAEFYTNLLNSTRKEIAATLLSMGHTEEGMRYSEAAVGQRDAGSSEAESDAPADNLSNLARHYRTQGDYHRWRNESEKSLAAYGKAVDLARKVAQKEAYDIEARRSLLIALSHLNMALAEFDPARRAADGQLPAELAEILALADEVLRVETDNEVLMMDKVIALDHATVYYRSSDQPEMALRSSLASLELAQRLLERAPDEAGFQSAVASSMHNHAMALKACGHHGDAIRELKRAIAILHKLAEKDPENVRWRRNLVASLVLIAELLAGSQRVDDALATLSRAETEAAWLTARDSSNSVATSLLGRVREQLCRVLMNRGRREEAKEVLRRHLGIRLQADGSLPEQIPLRHLSDLELIQMVLLDRWEEAGGAPGS